MHLIPLLARPNHMSPLVASWVGALVFMAVAGGMQLAGFDLRPYLRLLLVPVYLLTLWVCWPTARRHPNPPTRRAWGLMTAALGTFTLVAGVHGLSEALWPQRSTAVFGALYLLSPPLMIAGLLCMPRVQMGALGRAKLLVDLLTVTLAGGLLIWMYLGRGVWTATLVSQTACVLIEFVLAALVLLRPTTAAGVRAGRWACLALGVLLLGTMMSSTPVGQRWYAATHGALTWQVWGLLAACVATAAWVHLRDARLDSTRIRQRHVALTTLVPYAAFLLVYTLFFVDARRHSVPSTDLALACLAATVLMLLRQGLVIIENTRLNAELRASAARLSHQAQHDALTGLPNRALFAERLGQALARAERAGEGVAVMYLDLDGFKHVNDSLGHTTGDALLVQVAARLSAGLSAGGRTEDLVARLGGDEFAVLLQGVSGPEQVARLARGLLYALGGPVQVGGHSVHVSGSLGISLYPQDGADPAALQRQADLAMYQAKAAGRADLHFFTPELGDAARERLDLEERLRAALAAGALSLRYQPQVSPAGRLQGFEALLRWADPEMGEVAPARFVPVAEDSGLILPIGAWALREACRQLAEWRAQGAPDLRMAVNVSPLQFDRSEFVEEVQAALQAHGLPGEALELELTERLVLRGVDRAEAQFVQLRALGVRLAFDDFGGAHSAVHLLLRLPVDTLKLDRALVQGLDRAQEVPRPLRAILALGGALGLQVVAEGVETVAEREAVVALGCHRLQGHLLGRPLTPQAAGTLLSTLAQPGGSPDGMIQAGPPCPA